MVPHTLSAPVCAVVGSSAYTDANPHTHATRRVKSYVQRHGIKAAVASMSLGGPRSAALNDAVAELTNAGITVVAAAGELHALITNCKSLAAGALLHALINNTLPAACTCFQKHAQPLAHTRLCAVVKRPPSFPPYGLASCLLIFKAACSPLNALHSPALEHRQQPRR